MRVCAGHFPQLESEMKDLKPTAHLRQIMHYAGDERLVLQQWWAADDGTGEWRPVARTFDEDEQPPEGWQSEGGQ